VHARIEEQPEPAAATIAAEDEAAPAVEPTEEIVEPVAEKVVETSVEEKPAPVPEKATPSRRTPPARKAAKKKE
jgi:hypothetical protein